MYFDKIIKIMFLVREDDNIRDIKISMSHRSKLSNNKLTLGVESDVSIPQLKKRDSSMLTTNNDLKFTFLNEISPTTVLPKNYTK